MNLLGIIETLRRNLRTVVLGCYVALALVVVLDFVRLFAAHEPEGAAAEHATDFWTEFYHVSESWPAFWAAFGLGEHEGVGRDGQGDGDRAEHIEGRLVGACFVAAYLGHVDADAVREDLLG